MCCCGRAARRRSQAKQSRRSKSAKRRQGGRARGQAGDRAQGDRHPEGREQTAWLLPSRWPSPRWFPTKRRAASARRSSTRPSPTSLMQRPDKLRVITLGDGPASELYLQRQDDDGLFAGRESGGGRRCAADDRRDAASSPSIAPRSTFPFTDLIVTDPYTASPWAWSWPFISANRTWSAARRPTWWRTPAGRRVRADLDRRARTSCRGGCARCTADDPAQLRHEMELSNWQLDPAVAPEVCESEKASARPASSSRIRAEAPPGAKRAHAAGRAATRHAKTQVRRQRIMNKIIIGFMGC